MRGIELGLGMGCWHSKQRGGSGPGQIKEEGGLGGLEGNWPDKEFKIFQKAFYFKFSSRFKFKLNLNEFYTNLKLKHTTIQNKMQAI
jgi:hypothetical protein